MNEEQEADYRPHGFRTLLGEFYFLMDRDRETEIAAALDTLEPSYASRTEAIEAIRRVLPDTTRREIEVIASVIRIAPSDFDDAVYHD